MKILKSKHKKSCEQHAYTKTINYYESKTLKNIKNPKIYTFRKIL